MAAQDSLIDKIELSTRPENEYRIAFYLKFGFKDTGEMDEGGEVFVLNA